MCELNLITLYSATNSVKNNLLTRQLSIRREIIVEDMIVNVQRSPQLLNRLPSTECSYRSVHGHFKIKNRL